MARGSMNRENRLLVTIENFPDEYEHSQQENAKSKVNLDENEMIRACSVQVCVLGICDTKGLEY